MKSGLNKLYSRAIETYKLHQRLPQVDSSVQQLFRCQAPYIYKAPYLSIHRQVHISTKTQDTLSRTYSEDNLQGRKRKGKNSLRRVAVEAQRSRDVKEPEKIQVLQAQSTTKFVTAYCAAEEYDLDHVSRILDPLGERQDPYGVNLYPQVVHVEIPIDKNGSSNKGDLFVFPSGTVVGWAIPGSILSTVVSKTLLPAAQRPHPTKVEEEDMKFFEDPKKEYSSIKGDTIILGTKIASSSPNVEMMDSQNNPRHIPPSDETEPSHKRDTVLAKIAFSSGLAKSTKLAVLESQLNNYFETTKSMLDILARGGRLRKSRSFVLSKTGQLLNIRAQLNLYSELTDSLPDVFWDSRSELGLEGYYDQVGKALDTNIRVKELNEKMNYAQEIANVLRETLSERHGTRLEWIIIILIAVEICFNVLHEYRYHYEIERQELPKKGKASALA